jgi:hypothetical protein
MVSSLNRGPDHQAVGVTCVTCHRGYVRPLMMKDVLGASYAEHDGNIDAVIAKYREMRDKYYGGFAFDFGDFPVSALAFTLNNEGQSGELELAADVFRKLPKIDPEGRWVAGQLAEVKELLAEMENP